MIPKFDNQSNWPSCPKCKSKNIVHLAAIVGCIDCNWMGDIKSIIDNEASTYCLSKLSISDNLNLTAGQFGPFPQFSMPDFGGTLGCKVNEIFAISNSMRYWDKAREFCIKNKGLKPCAVLFDNLYKLPEVMQLGTKGDSVMSVLKRNASNKCAVIVFYTSDTPSGSITEEKVSCPGKYLVANIHMMNVPPINIACEISELSSKWGEVPPIVLTDQSIDIIWQPVDWKTVSVERKSGSLRYASGFQSSDGINATFGVEENLDNGSFRATGTVRSAPDPSPVKVKEYADIEAETADQAIELLSQKFKKLVDSYTTSEKKPVFSFELIFDIDRDSRSVTNEIQELPLWEDTAKAKVDLCMKSMKL